MSRKLMTLLGLVIAVSMVLAACGAPATAEPTEPPAPTAEPTPLPRMGAWVDSVVFTSIDQADQAVAQLQSGDIDVYAYSVADPGVFKTVTEDANLTYSTSLGSYNELTFNPSGPTFSDGRLNPFSNPKIREAVNMLVDRDNIVQNIYGGLAKPKFLPLNSAFADYVRYVEVARELEAKYAYNFDKAKAVFDAEMQAMGATIGADGKYLFNDAPVTVIAIIRTEDARKQIGDYVSNELDKAGFTVDRQYKTRSEASPIWNRSNPAEGQWHVYTGGWITTAISRDDGSNFAYFYSKLGGSSPLWKAYVPTEEYFTVSERLWNNEFANMDERGELFRSAMRLALEDSVRVWLMDQISFSPYKANITVAYDLAGGISGSQLWPFTIRIKDQEGGTVKIAQPGILVEPWNPIAGSNWIYDTMPRRATEDYGVISDPYTGLAWPQRIEKAEITVAEGLPITKTLDWVTLTTAAEIPVPEDAWVDWDAAAQKFLTVADAAVAKEVVAKVETKAGELGAALDPTKIDAAALTQLATDMGAFYNETSGKTIDVAAAVAAVDFGAKAAEINGAAIDETLAAKADELVAAVDLTKFDAAALKGVVTELAAAATVDVAAALEASAADIDAKVAEIAALATDDEKKAAITGYATGFVAPFIAAPAKNEAATAFAVEFANGLDTTTFGLAGRDFSSALTKRVVYYPADFFQTSKWHDGSPLTIGDFVMGMILTFDRAKTESAIYDEVAVGNYESFVSIFKGVKVISTDPLVIETYSDAYALDAELMVSDWYPVYGQGIGAWHNLALGIKAEAAKELTFSADKADALKTENEKIEWMSFISGPSLDVLKKYLDEAKAESFIPYAPTLGQYVSADEAAARYANLDAWYGKQGHFWIGTGPFYLDKAYPVEATLTLLRNPDYQDVATKWGGFGTPMVAEVTVDGQGQITIGSEATFDVFVTFEGQPYPADQIDAVKFLLYDAAGNLVVVGDAVAADGKYVITLTAEQTAALAAGANKLEVAVTSKAVSIPTFAAFEFVTAK